MMSTFNDRLEELLANPNAATITELRGDPQRFGLAPGSAELVIALKRLTALEAESISAGVDIVRNAKPAYWFNETGYEGSTGLAMLAGKWHDLSGNGVNATATSDGVNYGAIDATNIAVGTDGIVRRGWSIGVNQHFTLPSSPAIDWAYIVARPTATADAQGMFMANGSTQYWGAKQTSYPNPWATGGGQPGFAVNPVGGLRTTTHGAIRLYSWRNQLAPYVTGTSPSRVFAMGVDGYERMAKGHPASFTPGTLFGWSGSSLYDFIGTAYEVIAGSTPLTEAQRADIETLLAAKWGITLNCGSRFILIGDSIPAGQGATGYLDQLFGVYTTSTGLVDTAGDTTWNAMNFSVGSWTTQNVQGQTTAFNLAKPTNRRNELCVHCGTNDLVAGATVSDTIGRLASIGAQAKAGGYSGITLMPCLDRTGLSTSTKNAFNASAASLVGAGLFTRFVDPTAIPLLCADGAAANATYFQDGVHPTTAGHLLLAQAVRDNVIYK